MATPSSRASMESSPRPSPNSGALVSMSEGFTSSRSCEVMMSCFSSSISVFMMRELLFEEIFETTGDASRGDAVRLLLTIAERSERLWRVEFQAQTPGLFRNLPPGMALGERGGRAGDRHRQHLA